MQKAPPLPATVVRIRHDFDGRYRKIPACQAGGLAPPSILWVKRPKSSELQSFRQPFSPYKSTVSPMPLFNLFAHDRKSTRLNSSHYCAPLMPSFACKQKKYHTRHTTNES